MSHSSMPMKAPSSSQGPAPRLRPEKPLLVVLSGPSGVGKDSVLTRMKQSSYPLKYVTTVTTRARRPNERDGIDYHFVSAERFQELLRSNELFEWAQVYGNWYGIPKADVREGLNRGQDVIVKIDVQGAATVKRIVPQAVFIFLAPESMEDLQHRLKRRHTESAAELSLRLRTAEDEMRQLHLFDYVVVNRWNEIERAVGDIEAIIAAEKCRVIQREIIL